MQYSNKVTGTKANITAYCDRFNKRVRIDDYAGNLEEVKKMIEDSSKEINAEKIILKARSEHLLSFIEKGYVLEAVIRGFFNGNDVYFLAKFMTEERRMSAHWQKSEEIFTDVHGLEEETRNPLHRFQLQKAGVKDAERLAALYEKVFPVYPVPLQKPDYVRKAMESGTVFLFIEKNDEIISAASAEIDVFNGNAELTDCATLPSYRGGGLMKQLLNGLEAELAGQQIFCVYTIARSLSFGMNAAFKQLGYRYGGRLVNNCFIYDKMEDMNIWWKDLSRE
ncbi:putative beta-lysine N-acetyltransferase [Bacillus sp. SCS-153A]|uniref:putative beta-lysine N-acetyltransferase n=1 Tax=Rossellomorea sedimentorum TaxID=3115294 RepID=UPI0039060642